MELSRRDLITVVASTPLLAGAAKGETQATLAQRLRAIAAKTVTDGQTAGLGLGFQRRGQPALVSGFGKANLETDTPITDKTVFRIASCTKQFTAAAVVLLGERGKLSLQDSVDKYFPEFPAFPGGRGPTVHELLTHTAGLHDYVSGGFPSDAPSGWPYAPERWKLISRMKPLYDFEPGKFWLYSNSNYVLLGSIIERVSGQSYGDFMADNIFRRVGLTSTALDHYPDVVPHRASGYSVGAATPRTFRNAENSGLPVAEGGLRSTGGDLLKWNAALYGGRVVSDAGLRRMTQAATTTNGTPVGSAHFTVGGAPSNKPPAFVQQADYGYGLEVARIFDTPVIWHSGGLSGFNSLLFHFPERGADLALLANTDNGAVSAFEPVLRAVSSAT